MQDQQLARRARSVAAFCVGSLSAVNGLYEVTFGTRVPDISDAFAISVGVMGLVLGAFSAGLALGGGVVSLIASRKGTRFCLLLGAPLCFAPMIAIALIMLGGVPSSNAALWLALLWGVAGIGCGILDPAHAIVANHLAATSRLSVQGFLAIKMAATAAGAAVGGLAIATSVSVGVHFLAVGVTALVAGTIASATLRPVWSTPTTHDVGPDVGKRGLVLLGLLVGAAVVSLGGALNWATTMLDALDAPAGLIGSGVIGFAVAQGIGMLLAMALKRWVRPLTITLCGVGLALLGLVALGLVALHMEIGFLSFSVAIWLTVAGFVALGLGIAPVPGYVQIAAHSVRAAGVGSNTRITIVTMQQYVWQAVGPVGIGLLGSAIGVWWAFVAISAACVLAIPSGWKLLRHVDRS